MRKMESLSNLIYEPIDSTRAHRVLHHHHHLQGVDANPIF